MKKNIFRKFFILVWILLSFSGFSASAESVPLSLDVSNTLKAGKTFEVTLSASILLCALDLDIRFDTGVLEYKSTKAELSGGEVHARQTDDGIRLLYANATAKDGALLKLSFKALQNADTDVIFTPVLAAISDESLYNFESGITLSLSIGDNASFRTVSTPKGSSTPKKSTADSRSVSASSPDENDPKIIPDFYREVNYLRIILIAVGIAGLAAAALAVGFQLGKRSKKSLKNPIDSDDGYDDSEN